MNVLAILKLTIFCSKKYYDIQIIYILVELLAGKNYPHINMNYAYTQPLSTILGNLLLSTI